MSDDLQQFHTRNLAADPQYAVARQWLDLGEAVMQLREGAKLTRGQLGESSWASKRKTSQWLRKKPRVRPLVCWKPR